MPFTRKIIRALTLLVASMALLSAMVTAVFFPWATDPRADESSRALEYYTKAYEKVEDSDSTSSRAGLVPLPEKDQAYVDCARESNEKAKIPEMIASFVTQYNLAGKKVLDVGAGAGLLQDAVADYTGLDISPQAKRFFGRPFVAASATDMLFPDSSFDAVWSVWVLEHIRNPERALMEIRRVVKPGGMILLRPAFYVSPFVAQGYLVRPYSDFSFKGRIIKATSSIVESWLFRRLYSHQTRALRSIGVRLSPGPSRFRFIRLTPNYDRFWMPDSDATTSFSYHELYLWFHTRGDQCLNCPSEWRMIAKGKPTEYLIIRRR